MRHFTSILLFMFVLAPAMTSADTLLIDSVSQKSAAVSQATRGMTMDQVARHFGAPSQKMAPVGNPPITRWVYPNHTVYFEYQLVLTSVVNR